MAKFQDGLVQDLAAQSADVYLGDGLVAEFAPQLTSKLLELLQQLPEHEEDNLLEDRVWPNLCDTTRTLDRFYLVSLEGRFQTIVVRTCLNKGLVRTSVDLSGQSKRDLTTQPEIIWIPFAVVGFHIAAGEV